MENLRDNQTNGERIAELEKELADLETDFKKLELTRDGLKEKLAKLEENNHTLREKNILMSMLLQFGRVMWHPIENKWFYTPMDGKTFDRMGNYYGSLHYYDTFITHYVNVANDNEDFGYIGGPFYIKNPPKRRSFFELMTPNPSDSGNLFISQTFESFEELLKHITERGLI